MDYEEYLRRRWEEGCHNATRLFQEIRQQGYSGGRRMVAIVVSRWRKAFKAKQPAKPATYCTKHVAILIARAPDKRTPENQIFLDRLTATCPELIPLCKLALAFQTVLTSKNGLAMIRWIEVGTTLSIRAAGPICLWIKEGLVGGYSGGFALLRARVLLYITSLAFLPVAHAPRRPAPDIRCRAELADREVCPSVSRTGIGD